MQQPSILLTIWFLLVCKATAILNHENKTLLILQSVVHKVSNKGWITKVIFSLLSFKMAVALHTGGN